MAFEPELVGVSSVSMVIDDARRFAGVVKERLGAFTVLGGYHVTSIPHRLPPEFDVGVLGEGEETFAELARALRAGPLTPERLAGIVGTCYRDGETIKVNPRRELVADIDALPLPLRPRRYNDNEPVFTSRGCPFRCNFCASHGFWGDRTRFRSAQSVVQEIVELVGGDHPPKEIAIMDDLWIAQKSRFREIVEALVQAGVPKKTSFSGFCRSNLVGEEEILLFKKLNYHYVRFGAETGSDVLLRRIKGNNISIADHQRVIDLCAKHRLLCGASFIFGMPGETREDLALTIDFLRRNQGRLQIMGFYLFCPLPGAPIWGELVEQGKVNDDLNFGDLRLDLLKSNFSWDNLHYFNADLVPLDEFRETVERIKAEFIKPITADGNPKSRWRKWGRVLLPAPVRKLIKPTLRRAGLMND